MDPFEPGGQASLPTQDIVDQDPVIIKLQMIHILQQKLLLPVLQDIDGYTYLQGFRLVVRIIMLIRMGVQGLLMLVLVKVLSRLVLFFMLMPVVFLMIMLVGMILSFVEMPIKGLIAGHSSHPFPS